MGRREVIELLVGLAKNYCVTRRRIEPNSIDYGEGKFPYDGGDETSRTHHPCLGDIDLGKTNEVDFVIDPDFRKRVIGHCNNALEKCPTIHALRELGLGILGVAETSDIIGDDVISCPLFDHDYFESYFMMVSRGLNKLYGKLNPSKRA